MVEENNIITNLKCIINNSECLAFIIGNGINIYNNTNSGKNSWKNILLELNNKSESKLEDIPKGISYTEFYDLLLARDKSERNEILEKIINDLNEWKSSSTHKLIVKKIKMKVSPILTTNFDLCLSSFVSDFTFKKIANSKFTDYYPWSSYYSDKELVKPNDGFGIWHINGMIKYKRSIRLGITDYMGNVERARKMILKGDYSLSKIKPGNYMNNTDEYWEGKTTWLDIFFNRKLFIFGLALEENEIFLRWLLIERKKYINKQKITTNTGYFVDLKENINPGKELFLKSVGLEVIGLDNYSQIYEEIWK